MAQQKIFQPAILSLSKPIESANDGATRLKPLDKCPSNNYPLMGHYCGAKNASRGKLNLTKFAARVLSRGLQTFRCNVALVLFCFFSLQFKGKFINLLDFIFISYCTIVFEILRLNINPSTNLLFLFAKIK